MKKFEEYLNESVHINEEDVTEKSPLQKEYARVFKEILKKFEVESPGELDEEEKINFFNAIKVSGKKGEGARKDGEDLVDKMASMS